MTCRYFYTPEQPCEAVRAHIHGTCSACGDWAISYHRNRWTHIGEPCAARRDGQWVATHGTTEVRFIAGVTERTAA